MWATSVHASSSTTRTREQALPTENTINDKRDFDGGRMLKCLSELRRIGFAANLRLLQIVQVSSDCALGDAALQRLQPHRRIEGRRTSALRFADANAQAVPNAVLMFVFVASGFSNKNLRQLFSIGGQLEAKPRAQLCLGGQGYFVAVEGQCRGCRGQQAQDRRPFIDHGLAYRAASVAGRNSGSYMQRLIGLEPRPRAGAWPPCQPRRHDTAECRARRGDCRKLRGAEVANHRTGEYGGRLRGHILAWNYGDMPMSIHAQAVCVR